MSSGRGQVLSGARRVGAQGGGELLVELLRVRGRVHRAAEHVLLKSLLHTWTDVIDDVCSRPTRVSDWEATTDLSSASMDIWATGEPWARPGYENYSF